jgi:eukaryotic-like serine/threonine-protein kinase
VAALDTRLLWERWDDVDRLLSAVLDLQPAERPSYVRRQVPEDGPLRELVLGLVQRLDKDDGSVTTPPGVLIAEAFDEPAAGTSTGLAPGTVIGRYVIIGQRARGGMATVYEAERSDGVYQQRVALKVLRRGLDTDDLIQRFVTERQILSSLSHPNIARLFDGGSTSDGRPYLVMEFVDGLPITAWADAHRLDLRARLSLFLAVADAVHAAHRQLVVHRDIKPSNILVGADGGVKLLDFGIAKLVAAESAHTHRNVRVLTPEYASPEQLRGDGITTAADVYQLGLLLHELLTGIRPSAVEPPLRASRLTLMHVDGAPDPETRAVARGTTPERLNRQIRGDLDLVIAKALRPEPEERYPSADGLATDVRRQLDGLPVLAHVGSNLYRARKFVSRHGVSVAAAAAGLILLLTYAFTLTVQNRRIAAQRERAEREALKAEQVTAFMVDLFNSADPNRSGGERLTARELLDDGARRLDDTAVEDPAVRSAMLASIGNSYYQLGLYEQAVQHLESAVATLRGTGSDEAYARTLNELARVVALHDRSRALQIYEEAVQVAETSLGPDHPVLGVILADYSTTYGVIHRGDAAVEEMQARAVSILRAAPGDWRKQLASALSVWGYGRPAPVAMERIGEALRIRRALHPQRHTAVATSLNDLALITESVDPIGADSLMQEALDMLIAIHGRRHATVLSVMNNLAALRRDRGAYLEAEPLYREVLSLRQELYPEQRLQQAYPLYGLGVVLTETGRPGEGEARLREALAIFEELAPASPLMPVTQVAIGHALARQRRFAEAERHLLPALEAVLRGPLGGALKAESSQRATSLYEAWGRDGQADRYRRQTDSIAAAHGLTTRGSGAN